MQKGRSLERITGTDNYIAYAWKALGKKHEIQLRSSGLQVLIRSQILVENWLTDKTLITKEMLTKGFLVANSIYVSTEYTRQIISK